jgi:RTX calcium-binding nonapeptide repeat (4 copies)
MAILDASGAFYKIFDMGDRELVAFDSPLVGGTSTEASWKTIYDAPAGVSFPGETATLTAEGLNFTYDLAGKLTGGGLTSLQFVLGETGIIDSSVSLTSAIPLSVANLYTVGTAADVWSAQSQAFWAALLSGDDTIRAAPQANTAFTGDFYQVVAETDPVFLAGGDDRMSVNFETDPSSTWPGQAKTSGASLFDGLVGDAFLVEGEGNDIILIEATLDGGDDVITLLGFASMNATGDAFAVMNFGAVLGGNDTIVSNTHGALVALEPVTTRLTGDVNLAHEGAYISGGNDRITGSDYAFHSEIISGDVYEITGSEVIGGNDRLLGRGGQDFISGDIYNVVGGRVTGGKDVIGGGEDSDVIAGDIYSARVEFVGSLTFIGGADTISGDNGNDVIAGDALFRTSLNAASSLTGGNDTISGGEGNDTIYGDFGLATVSQATVAGGNDRIDGGNGDDSIDGQWGIDTALFNTVAAAVIADLVSGVATGQGSDTLDGIENLTGSRLGDTLKGDGGANRLDGGAGNDTLVGRTGRDVLVGGAGNDVLAGGAGADTQTGGSGADVFLFGPALTGAAVVDRVTDFADGIDKLDLSAFDFASFSAVRALATNAGGSLSINLPGSETILVTGLTFATFTSGDVIL